MANYNTGVVSQLAQPFSVPRWGATVFPVLGMPQISQLDDA